MMMKGTDFMRGKKILAWVLVSAMVLSSGMGKLFSRKSMPQVVSGTRIVSDPPDSSVKVADITPVTMPEGEYEEIYSGMCVEKMTFAALWEDIPSEDGTDGTGGGSLCKWCGEKHAGILGMIVGCFHRVFYFFARLFGQR